MTWVDKRLVCVEWKDAAVGNSWENAGTTFKSTMVWSVGLLWEDNDEILTLVGTVAENGDFNHYITIPRPNVVSIEDITK